MGASVAIAFAARYPTIPAAVILVDPPLNWAQVNLDVIEDPGGFEWAKEIIEFKRMTHDEIAQFARSKWPRWSDDEVRYWAEAKLRFSFNNIIDWSKANTLDTRAIRESMAHVTCPTLLIHADTTLGSIVSDKDAENLRQLIPHLQTVRIADAGHAISRDQQSHFLSAVRVFLTAHGL